MRKEIFLFILSMSPLGELRASIPFGILNDIPIYIVIPLSIAGNLVPVLFLLLLLPLISKIILKIPYIGSLYSKWLLYLERRHKRKFYKYGVFALIPFVAVPLPITGAWTGCFLSWIFGIPFKKAFPLIACGVVIASGVVTVLTLLGVELKTHFP